MITFTVDPTSDVESTMGCITCTLSALAAAITDRIASGQMISNDEGLEALMYHVDEYANALVRFWDGIEEEYTLTKKQIKAVG
jgi:hypothetical protein